jgi:hypothetical protein
VPNRARLTFNVRQNTVLIRNRNSSSAEPRTGDTTKRIVVFLFGGLFAVLSVAALFQEAFGLAALLGAPALTLFAVAVRGKRTSMIAAHEASTIIEDLAHLP